MLKYALCSFVNMLIFIKVLDDIHKRMAIFDDSQTNRNYYPAPLLLNAILIPRLPTPQIYK